MAEGLDLIVRVAPAADSDQEELAGLARRLRAELLDLDVETVEPLTADAAPVGAKGLSSLVGALSVRLGVAGLRVVLAKIRETNT